MEKIVLNINGQEVETEKGKTVLDAALDEGIYIPHICHHPDLNSVGACRLCIVEIEGTPGLPTSCTTPAEDGMVVKTKTVKIPRKIITLARITDLLLFTSTIAGKFILPQDVAIINIELSNPQSFHTELFFHSRPRIVIASL